MNENISASVHGLNENDLRQVESYAASRNTSVLVLFFTDMKGSSALKQRVTEVASEQVFHNTVKKEHDDIVGEVIRRDGNGAIIKDTGDGFFAVFAEPSTAVERALEIQAVLHGHPYIAVRIGVDMGQVIVQSSGGLHRDLFGRHVDWASRAMSLADGGHIIVTKAVATDAEGFIDKAQMQCKRHGFYVVKPGESPIEVFEPYNANITQPMPLLKGEHLENPSDRAALADLASRSVVRRKWTQAFAALLVLSVVVLIALFLRTGSGSKMPLQIPSDSKSGQVALWDAVIAGDVEGALAALKAGADVNGLDIRLHTAGPNGRRPLNYAAYRNDTAMMRALLRAGALIDGTNLSGFTPLHHAGEVGATDAAALLIARGASLTVKNHRFQTPLETAEASRHPETAAVIRRAMDQ